MTCDAVRDLAPVFVVGALDAAEEKAVREHLATCDRPHPEFEAFGGVVQYFDETVELIEPPASLKQRVMAAVAAEPGPRHGAGSAADAAVASASASGSKSGTTAGDAVPGIPVPRTMVARQPERRRAEPAGPRAVPLPGARDIEDRIERRTRRGRWFPLAAGVALVALAGWNIALQMQLGTANPYARAVADVIDLAARQGSETAILSGDGGRGPRGIAAIAADGSVALAIRELDPTVGSQVYEAWLTPPGGTSAPIGSFQVGSNGTASLTARATPVSGATITVTREPGRDATMPTLPILAKGVATARPS
jgi:anti-sigma-K factor RskA/putative zinc finger protein